MGMSRRDAVRRWNGLLPRVLEHLGKIRDQPDSEDRPHWKHEARVWLDSLEAVVRHAGEKTGREWQGTIDRCRTELGRGRRMNADRAAVRELYAKMFDALNEEDGTSELRQRRATFAFHMSDCATDIEELHRLASDPTGVDADANASRFYGLMFHLLPHLRAAFRALEGHECPDPFLEAEQQPLTPVGATA